jgi:hypothetical protein
MMTGNLKHAIDRLRVVPTWVYIVLAVIMIPVVMFAGFYVLSAFAFYQLMNEGSHDPADYPKYLAQWQADYPELVAHMPPTVPAGATKVKFDYLAGLLQAPSQMALYFVVTPAQVQSALNAFVPAPDTTDGQEDETIQYYLQKFKSPSAIDPLPGQSVIVIDTALDFNTGFDSGFVWGNPATGELLYYANWD